jgi:hypothetical protein
MINRVLLTIIAATVLSQFSMSGQKSPERVQPERVLEEGKLLFERGYYGLARETFASLRDMDASVTLKDDASFFEALSALRLEHGDAGYLFEKHLEDFPQSRHISHAYFRLGELAQNRHFVALRRLTPTTLTRMYALSFIISLATPTLSTVTIIKPQDTLLWSRMLTPNTVHRHPITMPTYFMKKETMKQLYAHLRNFVMSQASGILFHIILPRSIICRATMTRPSSMAHR